MRTADTRGQLCPAPLIAAKRVLKEVGAGDFFIVLTDNLTSYNNLIRFLKDNKTEVVTEENDGVWKLTVKKLSEESPHVRAEDYCAPEIAHFEKGDFIIVISSDRMGEGDDELGKLLMGNFIKALMDLEKLPQHIVLYNMGVTLATKNSPYIEHFRQLEKMGVEIQLCATCVGHFKLGENIGTGIFSNMYTIAEIMASAGKIVKP